FTQALRGARSGPRLAYHELRCLLGLAEVAAASGQTGMAARWYDEAEALATTSGDDQAFARALSGRAGLARANGDAARATRLYHQALDLEADTRDLPAMTRTFEALAALAAGGGQFEKAARLLGAASAIRERHGFARTAAEQAGYTGDLELTRQGLSAEAFADALWQGSRLSVAEALAYARRGRGGRRRATSGWPSLTTAERGVVALVAQGLTNPEVGERLFISRRTVQNHLAHVFAKLGITSRRELSEIAAEWGETLADA
ncbi:MAG: helix-turn-helix transcriptional regulator, partial [Acidimicrobiales bacterium]